jgi:hypothetical protein
MKHYTRLILTLIMCLSIQSQAADKTEWELWMPPNNAVVKAVFVAPRWGDGATMVRVIQQHLGAKLGIATLLSRTDELTFKEPHFVPSIPKTLSDAATELKHPELANAPLLLWSHSNAAAYIQRSLHVMPERIIAYCLFKSAFGHNNDLGTGKAAETLPYGYVSPIEKNSREKISQAATQVFGQTIWDKNDKISSPGYNQDHERRAMFTNIAAARKQGARIHVTIVQGTHHIIDGQESLMLNFFETAMAMRLPPDAGASKGPVKLVNVSENKGAFHDWTTNAVYAQETFPKDKDHRDSWWLPTWSYATLWNAYALNAKGRMLPGKNEIK